MWLIWPILNTTTVTSLSFFFGVLDRASVWEQAQTLPCCNGSAATLWLSLQFDGQTWLWLGLLAPDPSLFTPKPQVMVFLQGFQCWQLLCCPTTLHSLLHGFACSRVFLDQLQGLPQHRGFCSNAFTIHLYMCSSIDLHLLCPVKKYDWCHPRVAELFREAVVRHFTTHCCEALLLSGFQCYLGVFVLFSVAFHLLWEFYFGNNQMF